MNQLQLASCPVYAQEQAYKEEVKRVDGMKRRRSNDISHLSQEEVDELVERFVKEKGWYVPAIHEKYLLMGAGI